MAAGRVTEECAVAAPAERLWKAVLADQEHAVLPKACAGFIDAVEVEGDGGLRTVTSMRRNRSTRRWAEQPAGALNHLNSPTLKSEFFMVQTT